MTLQSEPGSQEVQEGTNGDDTLHGTSGSDRISGGRGNDRIIGGGGQDNLSGEGGDDYVESLGASGLTGIYGQAGNDTLVGSVEGYGQIHMGGGEGDDRIIMDLRNEAGWQGHHVYGGLGADEFVFRNIDATHSPILGRIDDLNLAEDSIWIDGRQIDLHNPPEGVRVVSYLGQQWLSIEDKALYALEGAREGGDERHFSGLPEGGIASLPTTQFIDQRNFIPAEHLPQDRTALNLIEGRGVDRTVDGSAGADFYYDYEVNRWEGDQRIETADKLIRMGGGDDFIEAGKGDDRARGGEGNDVIAGGGGNDRLYGDDGEDVLYGGSEGDFLEGALGNDLLFGGTGDDRLAGNAGNDTLHGEHGNDRLSGHEGHDEMHGGAGDDVLHGNAGNDRLTGGAGRDYLSGAEGDDVLEGGDGRDRLKGHSGSDELYGGAGNDNLMGGDGDDLVAGGLGRDVLTGDGGRDVLIGGEGVDTFVFHGGDMIDWDDLGGDAFGRARNLDLIEDFEVGQDMIRFSGSSGVRGMDDLSAWKMEIDGNDYFMLRVDATNERILVDVDDGVSWSSFFDDGTFIFG